MPRGDQLSRQWIQNVLSRDALQVLDQIRDRLGVRPTGAKLQAPAAEHLPKIHQALAEHRTLRTRYYSASRDSEATRSIDHLTLTCATRRGSSRWSACARWS